MNTSSFFSFIDFSGVFAGAVGGAIEAKRNEQYHFDFVGVLGLGFISALGGGIARDALLQHGPPLAFTDTRYLVIALAGGFLGLACGGLRGRNLGRWLVPIDATALGFFAVAGSTRALATGLSFLPAMLLGIVTAVGGGSLRDVFSGRAPRIFERGEPYALVAAIVSILFLVSHRLTGNAKLSTLIGIVVGFVARMLSLHFKWTTKVAR